MVLRVCSRSGLPCYYGVDKDTEAHQLGFHGASFLRASTDEDFQVTTTPYSPGFTQGVSPGVRLQTDGQQQMVHPFSARDSLLSSPGMVSIPVGLSGKELAQLRTNASRSETTDRRPSDYSSPPTTDGDALGGVAAENAPSPDARRLWSEVDLLRHEVQQLRAERSEPEAPPTYVSEAA